MACALNNGRIDRSSITAWTLAVLIGGANPVGVRIAVMELDPFWAAASRFVVASLVFILLMIIGRVGAGSKQSVSAAIVYGVVNIGMAFAFIYWGFQRTPAGTGQVLVSITPLATLILASVHGLEPLRLRPVIGALVALAGVSFVFVDQLSAAVPPYSLLAVVIGALCVAEGLVIVKQAPEAHPVTTNAIGMAVGGAVLALLSIAAGETWTLPARSETWGAVTFLIFGGSVGFSWLTVFIVRRWTASASSYLFVLLPPVTILYGAVYAGETVSLGFLLGGGLILLGMWFSGVLTRSNDQGRTHSAD